MAPPPCTPRLGPLDWNTVTERLGTPLPPDYIALIDCYGRDVPGSGWLRFADPLRERRGLVDFARLAGDAYRHNRRNLPHRFEFAVWPEPGGVIFFGDTLGGHYLGWRTRATPCQWPVVVVDPTGDAVDQPRGCLTDVLRDWWTGRVHLPSLPAQAGQPSAWSLTESFAPPQPLALTESYSTWDHAATAAATARVVRWAHNRGGRPLA